MMTWVYTRDAALHADKVGCHQAWCRTPARQRELCVTVSYTETEGGMHTRRKGGAHLEVAENHFGVVIKYFSLLPDALDDGVLGDGVMNLQGASHSPFQ
jgi:hypothetical protein